MQRSDARNMDTCSIMEKKEKYFIVGREVNQAAVIRCGFVRFSNGIYTDLWSRAVTSTPSWFYYSSRLDANIYGKADGEAEEWRTDGFRCRTDEDLRRAHVWLAMVDTTIIIITRANQKPGETRLDLVQKNTAIYRVSSQIIKRDFGGILLIVLNPVDILTYVRNWAGCRRTGCSVRAECN